MTCLRGRFDEMEGGRVGGAAFTDYFKECSLFLFLGVRMDKSGPISYGRYTDVSTDDNLKCSRPSFIGNIPQHSEVCAQFPALFILLHTLLFISRTG